MDNFRVVLDIIYIWVGDLTASQKPSSVLYLAF